MPLPLRHRTSALVLAALAFPFQSSAGVTTLTATDQAQLVGTSPAPLLFPIARSGDTTYPLVASYRTVDGSAFAGLDFQAVAGGLLTFAPGVTSADASVTLEPIPSGDPLAFQLELEGAVGLGPTPTFSATQSFDLTGGGANPLPSGIAAGDVNGDGAVDVVVAQFDASNVAVLLNSTAPGAASATFSTPAPFATAPGARAVAIADVNGDGRPDIVVAALIADKASVLLNTTAAGAPTPSFAAQQAFSVGAGPVAIAVRDLNGDGRADIVTGNSSSSDVSVLLNTTAPGALTATFAAAESFTIGGSAQDVVLADFNRDGRPDLALSNFNGGVSVLLNAMAPGAASATFAASEDFDTQGVPSGIAVVDLDDDGRPDLLAGRGSGNNAVVALRNNAIPGASRPTFAPATAFTINAGSVQLATADLNGDGKVDLVASGTPSSQGSVLLNRTPFGSTLPNLAAPQPVGSGAGAPNSVVADINRDGRPDLASAIISGSLSIALNTTAPLGLPTPQFATQKPFNTPQNSHALAPADFNGDGRADIAVSTGATSGLVAVLLNTSQPCADPTFTVQQTFAVGNSAYSVVAPDLNGDGRPDLVAGNFGSGNVSALLNTTAAGASTPTFTAQQTFATGAAGNLPQAIAAADMNGDGSPDIVAAVFVPGTMVIPPSSFVSVLLNTTAPGAATPSFATFQPFPLGDLVNADGVTTLDVNGDGRPDVAVADYNAPGLKVLINATTPGSATVSYAVGAPQAFATGASANAFVVTNADINGDGKPDLVATNYNGTPGPNNSVSVLLNTTAPGATTSSFATQQAFDTGDYPFSVAASDFDGDGRPDVVVGNYFDNNVSVLLNTTAPGAATPSLGAQQTFGVGSLPYAVAAADFNGDGKPDLVSANASSFNTSVLLNAQYLCRFAGNPATGTIAHDGVFKDSFEGS